MLVRVKLLIARCGVCDRSPHDHGGQWVPRAVDDHPHPYVPAQFPLTQSFAGCASLEDGRTKARTMFPHAQVVSAADITESV